MYFARRLPYRRSADLLKHADGNLLNLGPFAARAPSHDDPVWEPQSRLGNQTVSAARRKVNVDGGRWGSMEISGASICELRKAARGSGAHFTFGLAQDSWACEERASGNVCKGLRGGSHPFSGPTTAKGMDKIGFPPPGPSAPFNPPSDQVSVATERFLQWGRPSRSVPGQR
jgi:hypothetical protein